MTTYQYALKLISRKRYSKFLLRKKLLQLEHNEEQANEAIERLESNLYLNDLDYAKRRIVQLIHKGQSKSLIRRTLEMEGISLSSEEISLAANEENAPDDFEKISEMAQRKFERKVTEIDMNSFDGKKEWFKLKGKISYFLFRHGFNQEQSERIMRLLAKS